MATVEHCGGTRPHKEHEYLWSGSTTICPGVKKEPMTNAELESEHEHVFIVNQGMRLRVYSHTPNYLIDKGTVEVFSGPMPSPWTGDFSTWPTWVKAERRAQELREKALGIMALRFEGKPLDRHQIQFMRVYFSIDLGAA